MTFPADNLGVYLLIDDDMVDITSDVRGEGNIRVKTGYGSEGSRIAASEMTFRINDQVKSGKVRGRYVNRNPRSDLFGKLGRNLPVRCAMSFGYTDADGAYSDDADTFTRSLSSTWGTTSGSGSTWGTAAIGTSTATDWDVTGTQGTHYVDAAGEARISFLQGLRAADVDVSVTFTCPQATGGVLEPGNIMWRWLPSSFGGTGGFGLTRVEINTSNQVIIRIYGMTATGSTSSPISSVTTSITHTGTGQPLRLRTRVWGRYVWAKVWIAANAEPATWDLFVTDNGSSTFQGGVLGIRSGRGSGNTNSTDPQFAYDNFTMTVSIPRFNGEIPAWVFSPDHTGKDLVTSVSAGGIMRRITAPNAKALDSAVRRYITGKRISSAYYYLPMEEEFSATTFTPAVDPEAFPVITVTDAIAVPGADSDNFKGSKPLPTLGTSFLSTGPINGQNTGLIAAGFLVHFLDAGHTNDTELFQVLVSGSSVSRWTVHYTSASSGGLTIHGRDSSGVSVVNSGVLLSGVNGRSYKLALNLVQDGADVDYFLYLSEDQEVTVFGSGTFTTHTVGAPVRLGWNNSGSFEGATIGHAVLSTTDEDVSQFEDSPWGYNGETTGDRFTRLLEEEGALSQVIGTADTQMGPQRIDTLSNLLQETQEAEQGYLFEPVGFLGLGLLARGALINRAVSFQFDYSGNKLMSPLAPIEDEQLLINKFTATRRGGGSATSEVSSGSPLSTQEHPDGVGVYDASREYDVFADYQLPDIAGWQTYRGTYDAYRFASMVFDLIKWDPVTQSVLLIALAHVGTRYQVINLPDWLPPEQLDQLVVGYEETIMNSNTSRGWQIKYSTAPFNPYAVGLVNDSSTDYDDFRVDVWEPGVPGRRSTLAVSVNTTATSLSVASTGFLWTTGNTGTNPTDFPMDIMIDGERMTVTAITGTSSPQTFTVTRSENGIVKSHSAGTVPEVRPFLPWVISY